MYIITAQGRRQGAVEESAPRWPRAARAMTRKNDSEESRLEPAPARLAVLGPAEQVEVARGARVADRVLLVRALSVVGSAVLRGQAAGEGVLAAGAEALVLAAGEECLLRQYPLLGGGSAVGGDRLALLLLLAVAVVADRGFRPEDGGHLGRQ